MNKVIIALVALVALPSISFADSDSSASAANPQKAKPGEFRRRQNGGLVSIASEGCLAVLNAQKAIADETLAANVETLRKCARDVEVKVFPATFSLATAQAEVKKSGAGAAVFIVDDPTLPPSLIAMEEGWGMVNVAKLGGADVDAKKIETRFRKEFVRVTSVIFAGPQSQYRTSPLQTVRSIEALDKVVGENYGADATMGMMNNFSKIGVKPARIVPYRVACQEGVAPAPTNDIQKTIWEQVHQLPTEPLKLTK